MSVSKQQLSQSQRCVYEIIASKFLDCSKCHVKHCIHTECKDPDEKSESVFPYTTYAQCEECYPKFKNVDDKETCKGNFDLYHKISSKESFTKFFMKYEELFDMIFEYRRCASGCFSCFRVSSMKKIHERILQWSEENKKDEVPCNVHAALILEHKLLKWCNKWSQEEGIDFIFNYIIDKWLYL